MTASSPYRLLIDGHLVEGAAAMPVVNPATGEAFTESPRADAHQLNTAVAAAKKAFPAWATLPLASRAEMLHALANALDGETETLALTLTEEQGKPLAAATYEIGGSAAAFRGIAAMDLAPETLRDEPHSRILRQRTPLGVVALIVPWNFPILLMALKAAPALLAGNTLVIKPAPTTPLTTLRFGELCGRILPPGVVNVVTGGDDLGSALAGHPDVAKIAFTGSTDTGRKVMASAANRLARLSLELGGNDPAIVRADADPKMAAGAVFRAAMLNSGQICLGAKRVYVHAALHDVLCTELAALAEQTVVGDGREPGVQIGPLQNRAQLERAVRYLDEARQNGRIIAGGNQLDRPGYFVAPTIVCDLDDASPLVREEQFAPILAVLAYHNDAELVRRVNDTPYGLGATIWTSRPEAAIDLAGHIDAGIVWINTFMDLPFDVSVSAARQSGLGTALGREGLAAFTQARIINAAL